MHGERIACFGVAYTFYLLRGLDDETAVELLRACSEGGGGGEECDGGGGGGEM